MGFQEKFKNIRFVKQTKSFLQRIKIPTFEELDLYTLLKIYLTGLVRGAVTTRAGAISWSLFLSLFPFLLFIYSCLPYLPNFEVIERNLYEYLVDRVFPQNQANQIESYVSIIANRNKGTWFTIIIAVVFATNGINSLMTGFINTKRRIAGVRERNIFRQYLIAAIFTVLATGFLLFFLWSLNYMLNPSTEFLKSLVHLPETIDLIRKLILYGSAFTFFTMAVLFLYYYGVKFDGRLRNMLPGALMSTLLFFSLVLGFAFYIENFNNYNLLYGSISTLLVVMLFLYVTVIIILLGFELNMTLLFAKDKQESISKALEEERAMFLDDDVLEEEL